jgi:hypothetical protein
LTVLKAACCSALLVFRKVPQIVKWLTALATKQPPDSLEEVVDSFQPPSTGKVASTVIDDPDMFMQYQVPVVNKVC